MKSTVKGGRKDGKYFLVMDENIDNLRKEIWKIIFKNKNDISDCDIAMALSLVQYELIHHSNKSK